MLMVHENFIQFKLMACCYKKKKTSSYSNRVAQIFLFMLIGRYSATLPTHFSLIIYPLTGRQYQFVCLYE